VSKDLTPQEKDRRATEAAEGRLPRVEETAPATSSNTATLVWILVAVIVLVALASGSIMGFLGGRLFGPRVEYVDLLGAIIEDRGNKVVLDPVQAGGPANLAGLQTGDQLLSIDGKNITGAAQARSIIERHKTGDEIKVVIRRPPGMIHEYTVVLGVFGAAVTPIPPLPTPTIHYVPPPPDQDQSPSEARLGVKYRMVVPGDPFDVSDGAQIIVLHGGSPAEAAGLATGDIILSIDGRELTEDYTLNDALERYEEGESVRLRVWRQGRTFTVVVKLGGSGGTGAGY
jgi:S1-C subfamily serine protease